MEESTACEVMPVVIRNDEHDSCAREHCLVLRVSHGAYLKRSCHADLVVVGMAFFPWL